MSRSTKQFGPDFPEPRSMAEANERIAELADGIEGIQAQLTARKPAETLPEGEFVEYRRWRSKAVAARAHKTSRLRLLRQWLASQHRLITPALGTRRAVDVLVDLYHFAKDIDDPTDAERAVLSEAKTIVEEYERHRQEREQQQRERQGQAV